MELEFIERLRARLPDHPQLLLGVGDDAAVLQLGERSDCVVTADLLAEETHFELGEDDPRRIGRKALAVNLSDLAAMAAEPVAAVVSILLPREGALALAEALYDGILPLAAEFNTAIAGGDTNCWSGPLVIAVTAIGQTTARGPLRRDGARVGDAILVTGDFGGSRLGKQFDFQPRIREALLLHEQFELHAGIDVSDGLSLDLSRLCQASNCGAVLDVDAVPIASAAHQLARQTGQNLTALDHALEGGEDFELILAAPPEAREAMLAAQPLAIPLTCIGQFTEQPGLWTCRPDGQLTPLDPRGFEHA